MTKIVKDWIDGNTYHVLKNGVPAGYLKQVCPTEWKSFRASGEFVGWFTTKKQACGAL